MVFCKPVHLGSWFSESPSVLSLCRWGSWAKSSNPPCLSRSQPARKLSPRGKGNGEFDGRSIQRVGEGIWTSTRHWQLLLSTRMPDIWLLREVPEKKFHYLTVACWSWWYHGNQKWRDNVGSTFHFAHVSAPPMISQVWTQRDVWQLFSGQTSKNKTQEAET